jgi:hypothetical protein
LGKEYRSLSSSLCNFLHSPVTSFNYLHKSKNQINMANTIELHSIAVVKGNQFPETWSPTTYRSG